MKPSEVYRLAAEIVLDGAGYSAAWDALYAQGLYDDWLRFRGMELSDFRGVELSDYPPHREHICMALLLMAEIESDKEASEALLDKSKIRKLLDAGAGQRIARTAHGK